MVGVDGLVMGVAGGVIGVLVVGIVALAFGGDFSFWNKPRIDTVRTTPKGLSP